MKIHTERFYLRPLTKNDASQEYLSWFTDPIVKCNIKSSHQTLAELRAFLESKCNASNILFLGIFTKDNRHIGNIKFEPVDEIKQHTVMGILIGEASWRGQGVAGEVIPAACEWLRANRKIKTVGLGVEPHNLPAIKAYQHIGFVKATEQPHDDFIVMLLNLNQ
ncbi:GNAT family N-acetyltransferase [Pseudoalteromonas fenneropenaei]|uniref:GNAT family N-acetyltransferase n=1 Tax=Pseudoalteromonas fenneropenaei TaxID=1737459 RepID=A0ABV7CGY0_9GAMM